MTKIVIINKNGSITTKNIKNINPNDLYKKCGYKNNKNFKFIYSFKVKSKYINIYGKEVGRANNENKFEYPPPIDNKIYFGNMCALMTTTMLTSINCFNEDITFMDYTSDDWNKDYETLMGGFDETNNDDDDEEEDELQHIPDNKKTKEGYLKDDFVVDDNEDEDDEDADNEDDDNEDDNNNDNDCDNDDVSDGNDSDDDEVNDNVCDDSNDESYNEISDTDSEYSEITVCSELEEEDYVSE